MFRSPLCLESGREIKGRVQHRWLKVNTDAAFKNGKAAIGLVVRNEIGEIVLIMTKILGCKTTLMAELHAVEWATIYER